MRAQAYFYSRKGIGVKMIKAVIFDLDGTLIDTEKYYRVFWPKALAEFGYHMSDEQALFIRSLGRPFAPAQFRAWFGEDIDYVAVRQKRRDLMEAYLEQVGVEAKAGAAELLRGLKEKGILTAVATASDLERTNKYLKLTGLDGYFDRLISATQVKEGKPAPDIYLYACEQLGLSPEDCLAVEDSPNGVKSAFHAGCKVVFVPDQTEADAEIKPYLFAAVSTLSDVQNLI